VNSSLSFSMSDRLSVSPNPTAWKREARSWNPSGRLRMIRRKRLILQGLNRLRVSDDDSLLFAFSVASRRVFCDIADDSDRDGGRSASLDKDDGLCADDGTKPWMGSVPNVATRRAASAFDIVILLMVNYINAVYLR